MAVSVSIAAVLAIVVGCRRTTNVPATPAGGAVTRGGEIVASVHSEPRTFNRFVASDSTTDLVATLTQARLVRLNRVTQEI